MSTYEVRGDRGSYAVVTVPDDVQVAEITVTWDSKQVRVYLATNQPEEGSDG